MVNRRNRRRSRRPRRPQNAGKSNRRSLVIYRRPPNPGAVPRVTGLSAGGLTTTILFEIDVSVKRETPSANFSGWVDFPNITKHVSITPNAVFSARTDSVRGLLSLYSEYRFNRLTAHWIPSIGWASHGQFALALVDSGFGVPSTSTNYTYTDVANAPNSSQVHIGQRTGRAWVPTEPSGCDWRGPTGVAAHILYATSEVYAPIGAKENKHLGQILVRAQVSLRSPLAAYTRGLSTSPQREYFA